MHSLRQQFAEAARIIEESEYILFVGHGNPDGDSIGSLLGLQSAIKETLQNKKLLLYSQDEVPQNLRFLPESDAISNHISWYPDLIIGFDYGNFERLGLPEHVLHGARMITFDHHPADKQRGDVKIIQTEFSSTAELVHLFLKETKWNISQKTATCLLTGIFTDTGGFAHNTSANTLKSAGELINKGANLRTIHLKTFADKSPKILNIWGKLLQEVVVDRNYGYSAILLPFEKYRNYGIVLDDLTGLISILNAAYESKFTIFAVEYESGKVKGSLRSDKFKGVDVSQIARQLGGGGHKYASGFHLEHSFDRAHNMIQQAVKASFAARQLENIRLIGQI